MPSIMGWFFFILFFCSRTTHAHPLIHSIQVFNHQCYNPISNFSYFYEVGGASQFKNGTRGKNSIIIIMNTALIHLFWLAFKDHVWRPKPWKKVFAFHKVIENNFLAIVNPRGSRAIGILVLRIFKSSLPQ